MFEGSLVESTPLLRTRNRWPALVAIATQMMCVAVLLAIPLFHPEALILSASRLTNLAPPTLRPTPPPPQPERLPVVAVAAHGPVFAPATQAAHIPRQAQMTDAPPVDAPLLAAGLSGTRNALPFDVTGSSTSSTPNVVVSGPAGGEAHGPLRLSKGVTAGLLLAPIVPVYPPIARISHTEGVVVLQAVISATGHIESAHIVSGPTLLQAAAITAVEQARYRPYLLNGQPTEVETTVTIHFKLGS